MDPPEEQQEGVQQAEGGLGGLEAYGSLQELKLLAIVRRTFRGRVQLDSGWLKAAFSEYAVEAKVRALEFDWALEWLLPVPRATRGHPGRCWWAL